MPKNKQTSPVQKSKNISPKQMQAEYGLSPWLVYMGTQGRSPEGFPKPFRVGRLLYIDRAELEAYINKQKAMAESAPTKKEVRGAR